MKKVFMPVRFTNLAHEALYVGLFLILIVIWIIDLYHVKVNNSLQSTEIQEEITVEEPPIQEIQETHVLSDEELSLLYSCKEDVNSDTCIELTIEDAQRLMKIAVVEDNTNIESQAAIMECVLNRVASSEFPDTVKDVIEEPGQFSTVSNGMYYKAEPNLDSHLALAMIESGQAESDALFFEAAWAEDTWQSNHLDYVATIGGTRYYR